MNSAAVCATPVPTPYSMLRARGGGGGGLGGGGLQEVIAVPPRMRLWRAMCGRSCMCTGAQRAGRVEMERTILDFCLGFVLFFARVGCNHALGSWRAFEENETNPPPSRSQCWLP